MPTLVSSFKSKRLAAFMSEDSTPNEPPIRLYPAISGKNETNHHSNNGSNDKHDKITPDSYVFFFFFKYIFVFLFRIFVVKFQHFLSSFCYNFLRKTFCNILLIFASFFFCWFLIKILYFSLIFSSFVFNISFKFLIQFYFILFS